jgi:hypothetical protein
MVWYYFRYRNECTILRISHWVNSNDYSFTLDASALKPSDFCNIKGKTS